MSRNMRTWGLWCGVGTIAEKHEEVRELTKAEALNMAANLSATWPRVHIVQFGKNESGVVHGAIEHGRRCGIAAIRET